MDRVRAFVVGVSRYHPVDWDTTGPARNAWAVVRWLLANGVAPDRIDLFVDRDALAGTEKAQLAASGVQLRSTSHAEIKRYWRRELGDAASPGDKLFVFWSGHGMTDAEGRRILFCRDYEPDIPDNVFNVAEFIGLLREGRLANYADQLILADVCGTYARFKVEPSHVRPAAQSDAIEQTTIYATAAGKYAREADGQGQFTGALLKALGTFDRSWPEPTALVERLRAVAADWADKPFSVRWATRHGEDGARAGEDQTDDGDAASALALLRACALPSADLRRHYGLTIAELGPGLLRHYALVDMIAELAALDDGRSGGASFGLTLFLTRIASDTATHAAFAERIQAWIADHAYAPVRADVEGVLRREQQGRLLVLELAHDSRGQLTELSASLFHRDLVATSTFEAREIEVKSWDDLARATSSLVEECQSTNHATALEVHFLVDPPLLHLPFHHLPLAGAGALGALLPCVVHYRARIRGSLFARPLRWAQWAALVAAQPEAERRYAEISLTHVPQEPGIYWANFKLGPADACDVQKERLKQALGLGAPYMCWAHDDTALAEPGLAAFARKIIAASGLERLPETLLDERIVNFPIAGGISFLWDHPHFTPFGALQGST